MADQSATSLRRAIAILDALAVPLNEGRSGGRGVIEVARMVGREKSQVSRTLKVLASAGLVDRDSETLGYRLGWRFFALAATAADQQLLTAAPASLRALVRATGERAHLSVLDRSSVLTVLAESPPRSVQAAGWLGRPTPLYCTASGRALLFDHGDQAIRELLAGTDLVATGSQAPHDLDEIIVRVARARVRGYALSLDEFEDGLASAAAPVRDFRGRIVAALNASGPRFRLGQQLDLTGRRVRTAAHELSRQLGWTPEKPATGPHRSAPDRRSP